MTADTDALTRAAALAADWLDAADSRALFAPAGYDDMRAVFSGPLPPVGADPVEIVEDLARRAEPGVTVMDSPRFFGWVIGGSLPAARGADVLVSAWEQNNGLNATTPATAAVARQAGEWVVDLLGLPERCTVGFVTGGCMANFTGLAVARHKVLADVGWDVEQAGLMGAPAVRVIASEERHETLNLALRYLGFGSATVIAVPTDDQSRMRIPDLKAALESGAGPTIVALAAGNVNSGACDFFEQAIPLAREHGAWVHVDGAFGLWGAAAGNESVRSVLAGVAAADSWAVDAHKWLNVPYDCGIAIIADPAAHRATFGIASSYLIHSEGYPDPFELVPEYSQRARGVPVWAALRELGRDGVAALIDRTCAMARRFADGYAALDRAVVVNDVVLNQVLTRFGDDDAVTDEVVRRVVASGEAVVNRAVWKGQVVMRTSVSNWRTGPADVDRTVAAVRAALESLPSAG